MAIDSKRRTIADLIQQIRDAGGQKTIAKDGADLRILHSLQGASKRGRLELVAEDWKTVTYRLPPISVPDQELANA